MCGAAKLSLPTARGLCAAEGDARMTAQDRQQLEEFGWREHVHSGRARTRTARRPRSMLVKAAKLVREGRRASRAVRCASASSRPSICPFAQAPAKFGGRIRCSLTGADRCVRADEKFRPVSAATGRLRRNRRRLQDKRARPRANARKFPPLARLAAGAEILDVRRAADAQPGAISFSASRTSPREQRRLVGGRRNPAGFQQFARGFHRLPAARGGEKFFGDRHRHSRSVRATRRRARATVAVVAFREIGAARWTATRRA